MQSTTTDAQGFYQIQRADGAVETNRVWHVWSHGAESANRGMRVAAQVTLSGPPEGTQILTGPANKLTFTGTVTPADAGAQVILQRQNALTGNARHRIDSGVGGSEWRGGSFPITHTFHVVSPARPAPPCAGAQPGLGNVAQPVGTCLTYEISQAQNPRR